MNNPARQYKIAQQITSIFLILIFVIPSFLFSLLFPRPIYASGTYQLDTNFPVIVAGYDGFTSIYAIEEDDAYIYLGGGFQFIGKTKHNYMALYNKTTNQIETFSDHPDGEIEVAVPDGSGGWYVGGKFTKIGNHPIQNLVHIKADKTIDTAWTPNPDNRVRTIYYDGTYLYVGGDFTNIGGHAINRLAKLNAGTGAPVLTWNPNPNQNVFKVVKDGSDIYVAGEFNTIGGSPIYSLARVNDINGDADAAWDPNPILGTPLGIVQDIAISSSHVYAVGNFYTIAGSSRGNGAKLSKTAPITVDPWNPNTDQGIRTIHLNLPDGEIYIGGSFYTVGGETIGFAAKVNDTTGAVDTSWAQSVINGITHAILVSGSRVYLGGNFSNMGGDGTYYATSLSKTDATQIPSWTINFSDTVYTLAEQGQYIFIGGNFTIANAQKVRNIARFEKSTGNIDLTWNPQASHEVYAIAVDDTAVYVGGVFDSVGGVIRRKVAKLTKTTGNVVLGWEVPSIAWGDIVYTLALTPTYLYIGGDIGTHPQHTRRVNLTDGSGTGWPTISSYHVRKILHHPSGVYTGGSFTWIGGESRNYIAKLSEATGLADPSWDPSADNTVLAVHIKDNALFLGGTFNAIGTETRNNIAKLNLDGTLDMGWNVDLNQTVYDIETNDSDVLFVGEFSTINGDPIPYFGKADIATGAVDTSFNFEVDNNTFAILRSGNNLYIGGDFGSVQGNQYFKHIAKIVYTPSSTPSTPPPSSSSSSNQNQPTANNTQGKTNPLLAPTCDKEKPKGIPDLFQIDIKDRTAKLY
ncbi:MAG: delta-60 repeat domain-containing protein, partial [Candidatus Methanomethylicaceae archaeon]